MQYREWECECGNKWKEEVRYSRFSQNISGEQTVWCKNCGKRPLIGSPIQEGEIMQNKKAELVGHMQDWCADARVYKLDPPYQYIDWRNEQERLLDYVIVSAVVVAFTDTPEVLIFPATKIGNEHYEPIDMIEVFGQRHTLDHEDVLSKFGYEV